MEKILGKSWATTLVGLGLGVIQIAYPLLNGDSLTWEAIGKAVLFGLFGAITKQFNVTGGTVQQDGGTVPANKQLQKEAEEAGEKPIQ